MTKAELRKTKEYADAVEKIKNYRKGFTFTLNYAEIPKPQGNALKIITKDCIDNGILECISIGLNVHGEWVEDEYRRL